MNQLKDIKELTMLFEEVLVPQQIFSESVNDFVEFKNEACLKTSTTLVLMQVPPAGFSNEMKALLSKILSSVGLKIDEVPIMFYSREEMLKENSKSFASIKHVISFELSSVNAAIKNKIDHWITSGAIDQLDREAKTKLWNDMKQVFKPNMPQ